MTSTQPTPPPPPPPTSGYERQYYPMPQVPAPPAELIVFVLAWVVALIVTVAADSVDWPQFLVATTLISAAFIISRGIAKAGKVFERAPLSGPHVGFPLPRGGFERTFWPDVERARMLTCVGPRRTSRARAASRGGHGRSRARSQLAARLRAGRSTRWLEGGEFLLTTGLGIGETASLAARVRPPACQARIAGLGFGVACFSDAPDVEERDKLSFPVLAIPYVRAVRGDHEDGVRAPRERAARAADARSPCTSGCRTRSSAAAASRRSRSSATTWTAASRWRTRTDAS